jgi:hypothetical protein
MSDTKNTTNTDPKTGYELGTMDHLNSIELDIPKRTGKTNIAGRALTGYERSGYRFGGQR